MMIPSFRSDLIPLPCVVALSSALAGGQITEKECNGAQRVAQLEDSVKKLFHRTIWSKVEAGDTVLFAWRSLDKIIEAEITQCVTEPGLDGAPLVIARFLAFGLEFGGTFEPEETVYVQSRL